MRVVQKLQQHKTPIAKTKGDVAFGSKLFNVSRPNAAVPISKKNRPSQVDI